MTREQAELRMMEYPGLIVPVGRFLACWGLSERDEQAAKALGLEPVDMQTAGIEIWMTREEMEHRIMRYLLGEEL